MNGFSRALMMGALGLANAGANGDGDLFNVTLDYTAASRYVTHGFDVGGNNFSHQPWIAVTCSELPGFTLQYWTSLSMDRDKKFADEWDLMLIYNRTFCPDDPWALAFNGYVTYWGYPNITKDTDRHGNPIRNPKDFQGWKFNTGLSLPNRIILPNDQALVPGWNFFYWTPSADDQFKSGGVHEFYLKTSLPLPLPDGKGIPQSIGLMSTVNYHTGFLNIDSGWSHATATISTSAPLNDSFTWHSSINYQWSFEDTVNPDDEFWATLGLRASF